MKKLLLSAAAIGALVTGASAADLPAYEPPPVVAPVPEGFNWAGAYIGLQGGYAWGEFEANTIVGNNEDEVFDAEGFLGGVFVGYNFQFSDVFVLGIEGDFEGTGIDTDEDSFDFDEDDEDDNEDGEFDASVNWQASVRGRIGAAFDRALIYATGGIAFADFETDYDNGVDGGGDGDDDDGDDDVELGWTAGAGIDYAFTDNIFVRGEYRYADFADFDDEEDEALGEIQDLETHTIRGGVGFKF